MLKAKNGLMGDFQKIARSMSEKWNVTIVPSGTACLTDGTKIYFPFNSDYLSGASRKALHGLLDHEVAHICEERRHDDAGKLTPIQVLSSCKTKKEKMLINVFEDIRIECEYSKKYVGVAENISELNLYFVNEIKKSSTDLDLWKVICIAIIILSRGHKFDWAPTEYLPFVYAIRDEIEESVSTNWVEDSQKLAWRVIEKISDVVNEIEEEDTNTTDGAHIDFNSECDSLIRDMDSSHQPRFSLEFEIEPEFVDVMDGFKENINEEARRDVTDNKRYVRCSQAADRWVTPFKVGRQSYNKNKAKVVRQIFGMKGKLFGILVGKASITIKNGARRGKLDRRSLYKISLGAKDVFKTKVEGQHHNTAVVVLIDLSGSMGLGSTGASAGRAYYAKLTAIALGETFSTLRMPFEILGFRARSAAVDTECIEYTVFKAFNEEFRSCKTRLCIIEGSGNNIDGESVLAAAKRLYARPEERKILMVISDGMPRCCFVSSEVLEKNLFDTVKLVTSAGIEVIGIGIQTDAVLKFYNNKSDAANVVVNDLDDLAVEVYKTMKEMLVKRLIKA